MRADSAGARTWLLGATALWALCVWALALFGLAGRVDRLAEDPALLQRLPQSGKPPAERLGPLSQYAEIGRRPLFAEDRRRHPFFINPDGDGEGKNDFDFVLTSVINAPGFQMAILQPSGGGESVRVKLGDAPESAAGWTLASIDARSAVFNGPEGERRLELRVFDGSGGEPPTPLASGGGNPSTGGMQPPATGATMPPGPGQAVRDATDATPPPPARPATTTPTSSTEQIDAIRKRIEARRAKLRQQDAPPPPRKK